MTDIVVVIAHRDSRWSIDWWNARPSKLALLSRVRAFTMPGPAWRFTIASSACFL